MFAMRDAEPLENTVPLEDASQVERHHTSVFRGHGYGVAFTVAYGFHSCAASATPSPAVG